MEKEYTSCFSPLFSYQNSVHIWYMYFVVDCMLTKYWYASSGSIFIEIKHSYKQKNVAEIKFISPISHDKA